MVYFSGWIFQQFIYYYTKYIKKEDYLHIGKKIIYPIPSIKFYKKKKNKIKVKSRKFEFNIILHKKKK